MSANGTKQTLMSALSMSWRDLALDEATAIRPSAGDERSGGDGVDASASIFGGEDGWSAMRITRMGHGCLEHAHAEFGTVVCLERA
jgi:hypothetical protein